MATLDTRINLNADMDTLQAFAGEIAIVADGLSDLDLASAIIDKIDALPDAEWDAMTMNLKNWSNQINSAKQNLIEEDKKAAIAAKAQKTKAENSGLTAPTTPAAIKKAIEACKTKPEIEAAASDIARACGCGIPDFKKSWTIAKYKEFALANLKKVKEPLATDAGTSGTAEGTIARKTAKATAGETATAAGKTVKRNAGSPSEANVIAAKKTAKTTAAAKTVKKGGAKIEGEPYREGTTAHIIWSILKRSTVQTGMPLATLKEKSIAGFDAAKLESSNKEGRVTRVLADLKSKGLITRLETGNLILNENIK